MTNIIMGSRETSFNVDGKPSDIQIDLGIEITEQLKKVIEFILNNNIIHGDTLSTSDVVELTAYHFNDKAKTVKMAKAPINNLDMEYDETNEVDFMDMNKLEFEELTDW